MSGPKPRLLDLFCGAGGCSAGYASAGFDVVGVDIAQQPRYPFEFHQADALRILEVYTSDPEATIWKCDAIHASPPCQHYTEMQSVTNTSDSHPDLIQRTIELLEATGLPFVVENVMGSKKHLPNAYMLCGSMFGLGAQTHLGWLELRRHRLFETNFPWLVPGRCQHQGKVIGLYGDHARSARRHGSQSQFNAVDGLRYGREAMGIPWAEWDELKEAIPPAYTELIGVQLLAQVEAKARVA